MPQNRRKFSPQFQGRGRADSARADKPVAEVTRDICTASALKRAAELSSILGHVLIRFLRREPVQDPWYSPNFDSPAES